MAKIIQKYALIGNHIISADVLKTTAFVGTWSQCRNLLEIRERLSLTRKNFQQ
jgi:hypothetical protein